MDQNERQIIDELFGKLRQAEAQSGPRDAQAEGFIREQVARQPAAPYLMAQAIVIQEQALAQSQARIQQLEEQIRSRPAASSGGGGLFGGLFGGGSQQRQPAPPPSNSPWGNQGASSRSATRAWRSMPIRSTSSVRAVASWPARCRRPWASPVAC